MGHALCSDFVETFGNNSSIVLLIDPATGKIVDANPAAANYYGFAHDQLIGMQTSKVDADSSSSIDLFLNSALSDGPGSVSTRHRLASGEERDVEVHSSPIHVGTTPLLLSIVHDVSGSNVEERTGSQQGSVQLDL